MRVNVRLSFDLEVSDTMTLVDVQEVVKDFPGLAAVSYNDLPHHWNSVQVYEPVLDVSVMEVNNRTLMLRESRKKRSIREGFKKA